jgi:two-component system, OmpR family, sensor histidine kinase BaeS
VTLGSIRTRAALAAAAVALVTSAASLPVAILYFERRLEGLTPEVRRQVDPVFTANVPDDFDGIAELAVLVLATTVLGVVVGLAVTRRSTRVIGAVSAAAQRFGGGDLTARSGVPPSSSATEVARLARAFDDMAATVARLETERVASGAAIAHELRNPVAVLRGRLQAVHDGLFVADHDEIDRLLAQTRVLDRAIEDLRTLSLAHAGHLDLRWDEVDLAPMLRRVAADDARLQIDLAVPERLIVWADVERLQQAITNLLHNAARHGAGHVTITARDEPSIVAVDVVDDGPGIDPCEADRVSDPFVTIPTAAVGRGGSGLGLMIVQRIAHAHGGELTLVNEPKRGLRATLSLPHVPPRAELGGESSRLRRVLRR